MAYFFRTVAPGLSPASGSSAGVQACESGSFHPKLSGASFSVPEILPHVYVRLPEVAICMEYRNLLTFSSPFLHHPESSSPGELLHPVSFPWACCIECGGVTSSSPTTHDADGTLNEAETLGPGIDCEEIVTCPYRKIQYAHRLVCFGSIGHWGYHMLQLS